MFICTYDIPENTKQQLDENNIRYLSPYMNDNCFNSIFPKIENLDSCYYNEYKSYIETVVKYIISSVSNGDYNGFLEWLIARTKYCGFDTIEELIDNFIDCGNYIELKKPIDGINMIQKYCNIDVTIKAAIDYAGKLNIGGFTDWQIPSIDNLKTLYKLNSAYNIIHNDGVFWSSSMFERSREHPYNGGEYDYEEWRAGLWDIIHHAHRTLDFKTGDISSINTGFTSVQYFNEYGPSYLETSEVCNVICIRTTTQAQECAHVYSYYNGGEDDSKEECFITTAVCKTFGKPDDCPELTAFRTFRDTYMKEDEALNNEVNNYYEIAPKICAEIDAKGEAAARIEYERIWHTYLSKAYDALNNNEFKKAYQIYKDMVSKLQEIYL